MTRIFFSAGEASGDIHGANLIRALREEDPAILCEGLGGQRMKSAGMDLVYDLAGDAIMGFTEVVMSLAKIRRIFQQAVDRLRVERPDCLVVIDYPGFNLRLARAAHDLGVPVVYYISPQVWAWKRKRIHDIAETCRKVLVILPFEEAIYREAGVDCTYVGHPLLDHLETVHVQGKYREGVVVGLLPGSRAQEIRRILPVMIEVANGIRSRIPAARFVAPCVDASRQRQVREAAGSFPLETVVDETYEVLDGARFCLVASGTATVEAMLFAVPMIILYKVTPMTFRLARMLVRVEHIGMVNILAGRRLAPEFVQNDATAANILSDALALVEDTDARRQMLRDLGELRDRMGGPGASRRAAREVLNTVRGAANG